MPAPPLPKPELMQVFHAELRQRGFNPDDRWIGGYVAYEWDRARHVFECSGLPLNGQRVLEFGCNFGATAIVLAQLGARVTAVDIEPSLIELAHLNAAQYDLPQPIEFSHVADSAALPFDDGFFDVVVCNSVLEYVAPAQLPAVQQALDRVLRIGGTLLVMGTSNRLAAREVHSGRWLVNYVPSAFDRYFTRERWFQRGLWPQVVRYGFNSDYEDLDCLDRGDAYLRARQLMGCDRLKLRALGMVAALARPFGWSVGMLTPNISIRLRKSPPGANPTRVR